MISLFNGCTRSEIKVTPSNWNTKRASLNKYWRIFYRFYDPAFKDHPKYGKGKQVDIYGLNNYKDLEERQAVVRGIIQYEIQHIDVKGYNPISGKYMAPVIIESKPGSELEKDTPFITALRAVMNRLTLDRHTKEDITSIIKYLEKSAKMLDKEDTPISQITRKDIRLILDNCANVTRDDGKKKQWSANQFNHYRKYLSILYSEMEELEMVEYNPVHKIAKKETIETIKRVLTPDERKRIDDYTRNNHPLFHRYINIFFHSGARRNELCSLQGKDVELINQRFKVLIKKGKKKRWVWKTIKDIALPFWMEAMKDCSPESYVFGLGFKPAVKKVGSEYFTKHWKRIVKVKLGIDADLYSLKHLNSTEVVDQSGEDTAAELNGHTSTAMVVKIYDVRQGDRKHEKIRKLNNGFV